mmetsp:Transcript_20612/g.21394  ORF Transcript_20612/g.21394 Transcript_20612/m.21394 type:complete len:104 (-) Transcript_20612:25-336(-)
MDREMYKTLDKQFYEGMESSNKRKNSSMKSILVQDNQEFEDLDNLLYKNKTVESLCLNHCKDFNNECVRKCFKKYMLIHEFFSYQTEPLMSQLNNKINNLGKL